MFLRLLAALCAAWLMTCALWAQSERGTITGTIQDASGAVVPGAKVTLTNTQTGVVFAIPSNTEGEYTVPQLPVGIYTVKVEKEGFRPATISGIVLNASMTVRADGKLEVGAAATAVEVSASALAISTENAKTSVTITNKLVDELPLVVGGTLRSPFDLAALTPEAKNLGGDNGFILGGGQAAATAPTSTVSRQHDARAFQSWVSTNAPSLEAVTEFTVDTNGFKAEFGQAGGGVMNFASKSGTNAFHGSAYDFSATRSSTPTTSSTTARHSARDLQAARFRRLRRRPGLDSENLQRQEQDLLLLLLRSLPQSRRRERLRRNGSHAGNVQRRFHNWVDATGG